jgi:hypothetical protein
MTDHEGPKTRTTLTLKAPSTRTRTAKQPMTRTKAVASWTDAPYRTMQAEMDALSGGVRKPKKFFAA